MKNSIHKLQLPKKTKLTKKQKQLVSLLEEHDYRVGVYDEDVEIENWTDREEDMIISLPLKEFSVEELERFAEEYDIDEHIELMMQSGSPTDPRSYRANFTYQQAVQDQTDWLDNLREDIKAIKAALTGKPLRSVRITYRMEVTVTGTDPDDIRRAWENTDMHKGEFIEVVSAEDAQTLEDISAEINL